MHQGILEYNGVKCVIPVVIYLPCIDVDPGSSTVAVALWAMEAVGIKPSLKLTLDTVLEGGVGPIVPDNPGWTAEGREIWGWEEK